jgi:hypothetical protein
VEGEGFNGRGFWDRYKVVCRFEKVKGVDDVFEPGKLSWILEQRAAARQSP